MNEVKEISKIKIDNNIYNIKDLELRRLIKELSGLELTVENGGSDNLNTNLSKTV